MAKQTVVEYIDDITGESGNDVVTVQFALNGQHREIDLSQASREKLMEVMQPYLRASRPALKEQPGRQPGRRPARQGAGDRAHNLQVRQWCAENGHKVSLRGRIPSAALEAYYLANPSA